MNIEIFRWIHAGAGSQPIMDFFSVVAAEVTPYLVILCMAVFWFTTDNFGKQALLEVTATVALGLVINQIINLFYFHPRPFMMDLCQPPHTIVVVPLIPHAPETSFPSDHATLLFAASLALLLQAGWKRQGALLFFFAISGAWGRVYTGLHFPFDIVGSFFVALLSIAILANLRNIITPLYQQIVQQVNRIEDMIIPREPRTP